MENFLTLCFIEKTHSHLSCKTEWVREYFESVLQLVSRRRVKSLVGGSQSFVLFLFWFRRKHLLQLIDVMDLTGKIMKCSGGYAKCGWNLMCIIAKPSPASWLFCIAYPFQAHFTIWSTSLALHITGFYTFIILPLSLCTLNTRNQCLWKLWFPASADLMHKYGNPYHSKVWLIDCTFTAGSSPGGLCNVREKNWLDQHNVGTHSFQSMAAIFFQPLSCQ